ncbi:MAG TPA: hypothetical protein VJ044_10055 [Candidatus Hodarchaeales archaeon]|nr:hypothetical protein [Candidatus Hodarchaeales archaeon]
MVRTAEELGQLDKPSLTDLVQAAETYFEAAGCFDRRGDRKNSSKYFSAASDFFSEGGESDRSAEALGKAILRSIMADELNAAKTLLERSDGKEETFHFRLARESFIKRISDEFDNIYEREIKEKDISLIQGETDKEALYDQVAADVDLLSSQELEGIFSDADISKSAFLQPVGRHRTSFAGAVKGFDLTANLDNRQRERVIESLLSVSKTEVPRDLISSYTAQATDGRVVKPKRSQSLFQNQQNPEVGNLEDENQGPMAPGVQSGVDLVDFIIDRRPSQPAGSTPAGAETGLKASNQLPQRVGNLSGIPAAAQLALDGFGSTGGRTRGSEFTSSVAFENREDLGGVSLESTKFYSVSEVANPLDQTDLENVEIRDVIPLNWQVQNVKATKDFHLISQDLDAMTGSLVYVWKRGKLRAGEKAVIQYTFSKRIKRSIVAVSKTRFIVASSYHNVEISPKLGLVADIPFRNTLEENFDFLLIEDTIPQELKITGVIPQDIPFLKYHTADGILFRWQLGKVSKDSLLNIQYHLIERPVSFWLSKQVNFPQFSKAKLNITVIKEPLLDELSHEYVLYYDLSSDQIFNCNIEIIDQVIPLGASIDVLAAHPTWMQPTVEQEGGFVRALIWRNIEIEGTKHRKFAVRVRADQPIKLDKPQIVVKRDGKAGVSKNLAVIEDKALMEMIDLRPLLGVRILVSKS